MLTIKTPIHTTNLEVNRVVSAKDKSLIEELKYKMKAPSIKEVEYLRMEYEQQDIKLDDEPLLRSKELEHIDLIPHLPIEGIHMTNNVIPSKL